MNIAVRAGLVGLAALSAAWAGAELYLNRFKPAEERGMPVAVGEISRSTPSDALGEADPASLPQIKIPEKLPDFKLADLDGKITSIARWQGKSLLINFWATWCAPCRREIPLLQALHSEHAALGTEVLGIAVDYPAPVREFATRFKIGYPILIGEQDALDVAAAVGVQSPAFPFTVFTDRRGQVVALLMGEMHRAQADAILAVVAELNQDRIALSEARSRISERLAALNGKT